MNSESLSIYLAIAAVLSALSTTALVALGLWQLRHLRIQLRDEAERERKWQTVRACERLTSDPNLMRAARNIFRSCKSGTDFTGLNEPTHDIITFMNYLESVAVGVSQHIYREEIVKDNLHENVYKAVKVFLRGESGSLNSHAWQAKNRLFQDDEFPYLIRLYDQWNSKVVATTYADGGENQKGSFVPAWFSDKSRRKTPATRV